MWGIVPQLLRELRKENRELKRANEILKAGTAKGDRDRVRTRFQAPVHRWGRGSVRLCEQGWRERLIELVVLRTKQHQFSELIRSYLKRIEYGGDGWASSVHLPTYGAADVVVDPRVAFGLPLVVQGGARVEDLVDRFQAGDSVAGIAADFSVPRAQVEDVIRVATRAAA